MNERIKELAEQAGITLPDDSVYNGHIYRNSIEKFAQLIVKDCITIARSERNNMQFLASNPPQSAAAYDIERRIESNFGVK